MIESVLVMPGAQGNNAQVSFGVDGDSRTTSGRRESERLQRPHRGRRIQNLT